MLIVIGRRSPSAWMRNGSAATAWRSRSATVIAADRFGLGHDDDELLAAEARHQVDAAHAAQRAVRELAQHVIAGGMTVTGR